MREPKPGESVNVVTLLGIGVTFGVCVGIGAVIGIFADKAAGTSPLLVLLGVLMGILIGAFGAYQVIRPYVSSTRTTTLTQRTAQPSSGSVPTGSRPDEPDQTTEG